jgi:hypothetical protein
MKPDLLPRRLRLVKSAKQMKPVNSPTILENHRSSVDLLPILDVRIVCGASLISNTGRRDRPSWQSEFRADKSSISTISSC